MPKKIDLTGQKYNRLLVLHEIPERRNNRIYWHCKCDCGNECDVRGDSLKDGSVKSCGCLNKEIVTRDLTNQRFGKLIALEPTNKRKGTNVVWKCQCDCGNICEVDTGHLTTGGTKSCGCLVSEKASKDITNQKFGKLIVLYKTNKRTSDGSIIWHCKCDCGNECDINGHSLRSGHTQSCGCMKSAGEDKIQKILTKNSINFIKEKIFPDCVDKSYLKFDFYIPDKNYLIEYDGVQHYNTLSKTNPAWNNEKNVLEVKRRDLIKNLYCLKNNIILIRIPYTKYNTLILEDLLPETSNFIFKIEKDPDKVVEDLQKAIFYIQHKIDKLEEE